MAAEADGKPVSLSFDADEISLEWTGTTGAHVKISNDQVVGLISAHGVYTFFYITPDGDKGPGRLESVKIRSPALALLNRLTPSPSSFLEGIRADPEARPLHVIVSTASGTSQAETFSKTSLLPFLSALEIEYDLHTTTSESFVTDFIVKEILPSANAGHKENIVILSGDGGLVDILNALQSTTHSPSFVSPSISIVPMGTGNALANSTGVLDDKTSGLRTLLWGVPRALPAFRATFSPGARALADEARKEEVLTNVDGVPTNVGCVVCSWGLHAALVADSDTVEYRKFGAERFKMAAKENLFPSDGELPHAYKGRLKFIPQGKAEWQEVERTEHGYVLSTLVSHLEAGFHVNPASKPLDGVLRLLHFKALSGQEAMEIMGKAYQGGKHIDDERVEYLPISALRIEFAEDDARWRRVCIDGKIIRVEKGGWVEVRAPVESGIDIVTILTPTNL